MLSTLTNSSVPHLDRLSFLCVHDLFSERAEADGSRIAARCDDRTVTYRELDRNSNQVANLLVDGGLRPEGLIAVWMDRSLEMLAALLGILKAGGAYLPLDPCYPPDRIDSILKCARPQAILASPGLADRLPATAGRIIPIDSKRLGIDSDLSTTPVRTTVGPHSLAYVIYTSGSTGKPKGVQIEHGSLANVLQVLRRELLITAGDVFGAVTTICFDIAAVELLMPLIAGASVLVVSRSTASDGASLAVDLDQYGVTYLQATPATWRMLIESGWKGRSNLRIVCGGEPLSGKLCAQLLERGATVWNAYGPTEATIWATTRQMTVADTRITIGHPLEGYTVYILDSRLNPVDTGEIGEVFIGGSGLARGYLNEPRLTAEKFVRDPFLAEPGARMYRTGDLGRFLPDGDIELLGRADHQVKIRGFRLELGEVESVLERHPDVGQCVAAVFAGESGDQRLVAFCVMLGSARLNPDELRDLARKWLPSHAVPCQFVAVDSLPLTPNGKVDRRALRVPPTVATSGQDPVGEQSLDPLERSILEIWKSVLNRGDVGPDDDFFDVGGHSLLVARVFAKIAGLRGRTMPLGVIAECPTVRKLAAHLRDTAPDPNRVIVPLKSTGTAPPLYVVHHLEGDVVIYRNLVAPFDANRPLIGLQPPENLLERPELLSIESLAALYVRELLTTQRHGPYHLAGYSSGGVIAFEMAQQLTRMGHTVGALGLIDAEVLAPGPPMPRLRKFWKTLSRRARLFAFRIRTDRWTDILTRRIGYEMFRIHMRRARKAAWLPGTPADGFSLKQVLAMMESAYHPTRYPGPALLIRARGECSEYGPDPLMGWSSLIAGPLQVHDLPGSHLSLFTRPIVDELAQSLCQDAMAREQSLHPAGSSSAG